MEKLLEIALMLCWDAVKALILQWLIDGIKDWWATRKNSSSLRTA